MAEYLVTFAAGASYGLTTVVVGQPLDTIKVRMQGMPTIGAKEGSVRVAMELFRREGLVGLYRGGLPLFIGGSLMRSAQFGVSGQTKHWLDSHHQHLPQFQLFGLLDWQVIAAGIAGGLGRGLVEIPTDFLKTRRQVEKSWTWTHLMDGTGITLARNTVLYTAFMVNIDLSKQACQAGYVPTVLMNSEQTGLTPFAKGAICANMAWLTVWPADVIKTQRQSGNYEKSTLSLLRDNLRSGRLFRGIIPGLIRSSVANGSSMVVYEWTHTTLSSYWNLQERRDMT
ncbi:Mitochondrial basic amino acids transporter [Seminavis robusta]|uniref:Mitochondrial basic amino acids transporter n=1 Tax=Seminavis robusta TaxID=568900 RepID=A0A9N8DIF9_9STRA|nr:Mitochondrial basic amino acids transporter [Seminavis robusta]|eukprot:Sro144_g066900.1 Mitochondrial basic amino acids transporter (283) ;mRNA; r:21994-22842